MIEFFLRRRVLTNLITLFVVVVGGWQALTVRREAFPDVSFDVVTITTLYPGASPEEVESLVTRPIEEELRGINGVDKVESYSIENRSVIVVRLHEDLRDAQVTRAVNDLHQALQRVRDLPAEVERPIVEERTSQLRPLITLSVAGGSDEARDRWAEELKDSIEDVPGVAKVTPEGDRKREVWVEADPGLLKRRGVTLGELAQAIRARNVDASAGMVETGRVERFVRVTGEARGARELGEFIVRGNDARSYVRVRDVATVRETFEEPRTLVRANGMPAISLKATKRRAGDVIKMSAAVRRIKEEAEARAGKDGVTLIISEDMSFFVKRRLKVMTNNLMQGGVLILIALFLFLDWRLAAVAAWGVPISFAAAMLVAVPLGFTIDLLSLLAFIIVLGMLDDDSVVVAENIYRHLEMGKPPERAAVEGAREVALPVVGSVMVSTCAFLPFAMMSGVMGKFMFMIPVIVCMCFLASVFEAFFILPSHVLDILPFGRPIVDERESRWYHAAVGAYETALRWVLRHKGRFLALVMAFLALTGVLVKLRLKFVLFPPGLIDQFFIQIEMPRGSSLTESRRVLEEVERIVLALPREELSAVTATVGQKGFEETLRLGTHYAQARVFLTPDETRPRRTKAIIEELRAKVARVAGAERIVFQEMRPGPPVGQAVLVRARGRDRKVLGEIIEEIKAELRGIEGVRDIQDSTEGGKDQWRAVLDDREAAFAGLDMGRVARGLFLAVDGGDVSRIHRPDEEVKVRVRLAPQARASQSDLLGLEVLNPEGRRVSLGRVARIENRQGPPYLSRYNFKQTLSVTADVDLSRVTSREANARLRRKFEDLPRKRPGYELIFGGEEERTEQSMRSLYRSFGVALLLNFVILAALFRSYVRPLIILTTVPIGLLGVAYALFLHGAPASFMALLGVVAMTGVVVNNAIVLVDFTNSRREAGRPLVEAAVEAGKGRLRPIWASSITTLLGLFPTAYGFGGYEPFVAPMALALAWGLTIAMPMTLFLIPACYVFVEESRDFLRGLLRRGSRKGPGAPAAQDRAQASRPAEASRR